MTTRITSGQTTAQIINAALGPIYSGGNTSGITTHVTTWQPIIQINNVALTSIYLRVLFYWILKRFH